jgi:hypothetical protein
MQNNSKLKKDLGLIWRCCYEKCDAIKGGFLIAAMVGLDTRATMEAFTTPLLYHL